MVSYILTLDKQFLIQLAWQLLNTIILCTILSFLLYKPVLNFLNKRKEKIKNQIVSAEKQLADAENLKNEYEARLKEIDSERDTILIDARSRAKKSEQDIISQAKQEAEAIKNRAMIDIQREQEKAKDEMHRQIIEISSLIAGRYIAGSIDSNQQNKLFEEVVSDLGEVKWTS